MNKDNEKINIVCLLSNWYSGATLLSILLNNHKQITCNGESFPWGGEKLIDYVCSCGNIVDQCKFYQTTCSAMWSKKEKRWNRDLFRILPHISRNNLANKFLNGVTHFRTMRNGVIRFVPSYSNKVESFLQTHINFMQNALIFDNSLVYIDGIKNVRRAELFADSEKISLKIIYLVRDGRGFCSSWLKNRDKSPEIHIDTAIDKWIEYNSLVKDFSNHYPKTPILTVRYEDLCTDVNSTISKICQFSGVEYDKNLHSFNPSTPYHVLGNRMRRTFSGKVEEDKSWESRLTKEQISLINDRANNDLCKFGYI